MEAAKALLVVRAGPTPADVAPYYRAVTELNDALSAVLGEGEIAIGDVTLEALGPKSREQIAHYQNGTNAWQGWRQRWTYNFGADGTNLASTYETTNPSTWGAIGTDDAMFYDHYHGLSTHGSAVGQAIVMGLIGRVRHWGINMFASIWWHMTTPTAAMLTATSRTPEKFEYWHDVPRPNGGTIGPEYALGYSYRGGSGGVFQSGHWPLAMVTALRPSLTYATAISLGFTDPVAVIFDDPQYGVAMQVECVWATPGQASRIWWGEADSLPETDAQMWAAGSANANVPNAYGYHRNSLTIPVVANTVAHEAGWAVAIVYDLGGGSYISTPLILLDIPTPVAQIEP